MDLGILKGASILQWPAAQDQGRTLTKAAKGIVWGQGWVGVDNSDDLAGRFFANNLDELTDLVAVRGPVEPVEPGDLRGAVLVRRCVLGQEVEVELQRRVAATVDHGQSAMGSLD